MTERPVEQEGGVDDDRSEGGTPHEDRDAPDQAGIIERETEDPGTETPPSPSV